MAPLLSLGLVAGVWAEWRTFHRLIGDPNTYHAAVRTAAARLPERVGAWRAASVDAPRKDAATGALNLALAREYRNATTAQRANLTLVQTRNAVDLQGYWPPVRFPAEGWTLRVTESRSISLDDLRLPVTAYRFAIESSSRHAEIVVYSTVMRPGGKLSDGRTGIHEAEDDSRMRVFGAALLQVTFDASVAPESRDEVFRTLVGGARPIMDVVLGEVGR
jgi:hypothetical protein